MKTRIPGGMLLACGLVASGAGAQSSDGGGLMGTVTVERADRPLADVAVRIVSQELSGELRVWTDANGHFHVPRLAPGLYTVHFEKEGFWDWVPVRAGVRVQLGRTTRADMVLPPEYACTWLDLSTEGLDTMSTATGLHVGPDFFRRIAVR
ncbi:carboxypeptidase-like regulatory domain-containing protein [Myxococcus sp. K15C18031901]|uniref:carboxypeptidase-like regulatory domain-containing protein n=1 Tax=Myxococcus dinghuensis TaxID=2906761 RepID=UPI0020A6DCFD|nr:carboxypeptidase regulatory-like domain-containing protein [Myxococcus dinghuensis]MCP3103047.1 carboxypeptidase-like regulatory domain-containing protein [Myxococcus dinghuensis]